MRILLACLLVAGCAGTNHVTVDRLPSSGGTWELNIGADTARIDSMGTLTRILFRKRIFVIEGFDHFSGTLRPSRVELKGPQMRVLLTEKALTIEPTGAASLVRPLDAISEGSTARYAEGRLLVLAPAN